MKTIDNIIFEGKNNSSIISLLKDGEDQISSMIVKRMENYDKNVGKHSREPMFLTDDNFESLSWVRVDMLNTEVGDPNNSTDNSKLVGLYDGFFNDYILHKETTNNKYILGIFIERCFIPILTKENFDKIWEFINK